MSKNTKNTYKNNFSHKPFNRAVESVSDESLSPVSAGTKARSMREEARNYDNMNNAYDSIDSLDADLAESCMQMLDRLR